MSERNNSSQSTEQYEVNCTEGDRVKVNEPVDANWYKVYRSEVENVMSSKDNPLVQRAGEAVVEVTRDDGAETIVRQSNVESLE